VRNPRIVVLDEDEALTAQVVRATSHLRPRTEVTRCDSFAGVDALAAETGPIDILFAGPMSSRQTGLQELRRLRARVPGMRLILAVDQWQRAALRDTVRTGALDILKLPVSDDVVLDAVEQALEIEVTGPGATGVERPAGDVEGAVIAVVSATGGCGKTFFATNLAYYLKERYGREACLLDLDLQFGEVSTALRLKPRRTISDLLSIDDDPGQLGRNLEEHLERHESGILVLAAPLDPAAADAIDALGVARIIEAARSRFSYVVIDTPAALSEAVLVAVEQADQIFALATLDLPSVRNLGVMLSTFNQLKVPAERVKLVLNKVEPDVGIDVGRVEKYFSQGFAMVIPYGREANRSLNMGFPLLAYAPRGQISRALESGLTANVIGPMAGDGVADESVPARRRRLGRRHKKGA